MELVQIDIIGTKIFQRLFKLPPNIVYTPKLIALEISLVSMTEFRGQKPMVPVGGDRLPHQPLGHAIPVALSRINQIDSCFPADIHDFIHFILAVLLTPLTAELPCSQADNRYFPVPEREFPIFHVVQYKT
nr:hypothetical protein [Roseovarius pacificus]